MKIKYDPEVDAAYISFKKGPIQVTTLRLSEDWLSISAHMRK